MGTDACLPAVNIGVRCLELLPQKGAHVRTLACTRKHNTAHVHPHPRPHACTHVPTHTLTQAHTHAPLPARGSRL